MQGQILAIIIKFSVFLFRAFYGSQNFEFMRTLPENFPSMQNLLCTSSVECKAHLSGDIFSSVPQTLPVSIKVRSFGRVLIVLLFMNVILQGAALSKYVLY